MQKSIYKQEIFIKNSNFQYETKIEIVENVIEEKRFNTNKIFDFDEYDFRKLTKLQKEIFNLRFYLNKEINQIANKLNLPNWIVQRHISKICGKLASFD